MVIKKKWSYFVTERCAVGGSSHLLQAAALFLVCVSVCDAHVCFAEFSSNRCTSGVLSDTGYSDDVVQWTWRKYAPQLIAHATGLDAFQVYVRGGNHALEQRVGLCYYAMLWYMHIYPTEAAIPGWSFGGVYRFTKKRFFEEIMPIMLQLSTLIDEIDYADRLHRDNHGTGLFAKRFTTMIDCCPIWVAEPTDPFWSDLLFQGKYGGSCFKIQIGINWLGWIVLFTGLHVGTKTDDEIWNDTAAAHPFMHWEWWLGDAAYSTCLGVLTRHVQDPHSILWQDEAYVNAYLNFYRQYVEHSMHLIKDHGMWRVSDLLCCCASPFSLFVLAGGQHSQQPAGAASLH